MGCAASKAEDEDRFNQKIQEQQQDAAKTEARTMKLLMLGTGDAGKTTLRKQMRFLFGDGFPAHTRKLLAPILVSNLIEGTKEILQALPILNIELPAELAESVAYVKNLPAPPQYLDETLANHVKALVKSEQFKEAIQQRRLFHLQDCWHGFSKSLLENEGWGKEDYVPTPEECVSARVRTSGIVEEKFMIDGVNFHICDVGGQRAERRKWIHSFDNVTAVIFVTAISEYDQNLFEDNTRNRLEEAFVLFEEICNSRWFSNVPIMLFLNKKDLFEQKLLHDKVPLNVSGMFPTAPEDSTDVKGAIDWITNQFLERRKNREKDVYTYVTTATDPDIVRAVFDLCRSIILKRNLLSAGFLGANKKL